MAFIDYYIELKTENADKRSNHNSDFVNDIFVCSNCGKIFRRWESHKIYRSLKSYLERKNEELNGNDNNKEVEKISYLLHSNKNTEYSNYSFYNFHHSCPNCKSLETKKIEDEYNLNVSEKNEIDELYKLSKLKKKELNKLIKIKNIENEEKRQQKIYEIIKSDIESWKNK